MDAHAGQYCICNDGWAGVDCSTVDAWHSDRNRTGSGNALAGAGLTGHLMLQLEQTLQKGLLQTRLDLEALTRRVASNDETVLGRKDAAQRAMESFRLQVEADNKELALQHEVLLDELHQGRDQLERDTEERSSALRRTLTARAEQHHATERRLHEDTQRRQNRFSRMQRMDVRLHAHRDAMPDTATTTQLTCFRLLSVLTVLHPAIVLLCRTCASHCGTTSLSIWIRNDSTQPAPFATSRRSPMVTTTASS
jgi:hypothetical protein